MEVGKWQCVQTDLLLYSCYYQAFMIEHPGSLASYSNPELIYSCLLQSSFIVFNKSKRMIALSVLYVHILHLWCNSAKSIFIGVIFSCTVQHIAENANVTDASAFSSHVDINRPLLSHYTLSILWKHARILGGKMCYPIRWEELEEFFFNSLLREYMASVEDILVCLTYLKHTHTVSNLEKK